MLYLNLAAEYTTVTSVVSISNLEVKGGCFLYLETNNGTFNIFAAKTCYPNTFQQSWELQPPLITHAYIQLPLIRKLQRVASSGKVQQAVTQSRVLAWLSAPTLKPQHHCATTLGNTEITRYALGEDPWVNHLANYLTHVVCSD